MTNTNSVFSCDEQDSLDYNGYKLYRLVLENPPYDWEDWSRKELMTLYANQLNR